MLCFSHVYARLIVGRVGLNMLVIFGPDLGHFLNTFLDELENASSLLFIYFAGDFICILSRNCF